ncbi:acyl-CoA synthetase [Vibrio panuliri]|uniref:Acyl-CoA synthetase n=1 Tax=Vibrio panuliri TaxID=1381081 RepID=A0A1Q9HET5_9VIBR|nr:acyl-CoA synthetase [Vibrio panuliri]KAB1454618.1 acyl-CoA synthetase [Vibrio panuliri]OLQ88226.1 acyl-CoA synthetase [Vibrio panuliri]OLQ90766.1 acyl-CoA synthetase [Vibrio panuliri]
MSKHNIYHIGLEKTPANYESLSPLSFLERAAAVYPTYTATVHGDIHKTWRETEVRCRKLASALQKQGIGEGDTVSVIAPNLPELFEMHFGVPMSGAVLNAINTRLDADAIAFIFQHAESKVVIVDKEFTEVVKKALKMIAHRPLVIAIDDPLYTEGELISELTYEEFILDGDPEFQYWPPSDEWQAISLNYTSGTTGNPKGVVYHHRGAHLNAVSNIMSWDMGSHPVYLWTLPMFHCNGWCFPWTIAASAGVSVSLRHVRADAIFNSIKQNQVTHFCAAPIVLNMMNNADVDLKADIHHQIKAMTAGAAPPASVIEGMEALGIEVTHVYGLTETFGPCVVCDWQRDWDDLNNTERARMKARQGVRAPMQGQLMVANPITMQPVAKNGEEMGEIFLRGNIVMKGYLKNPSTSDEAMAEGWFHTGDLAVWHSDNYIEIKDRSKDIIISGGENISSIEIEDVLYRHEYVEEVAVIAMADEKWGEVPCAFVKTKDDVELTQQELIAFCRSQMAHFKVPKKFIFTALPKTSTGKVQKYVLRGRVNE